jgi:hypothetical protein
MLRAERKSELERRASEVTLHYFDQLAMTLAAVHAHAHAALECELAAGSRRYSDGDIRFSGEAPSRASAKSARGLAGGLKELVQRRRVDEFAQEDDAAVTNAQQVHRRLPEGSSRAVADDVELDDPDLGIRCLMEGDVLMPQDPALHLRGSFPDSSECGADRLPAFQARGRRLQPKGPFHDPVHGEALDPGVDIPRDLMRDEVFPNFVD